VLAEKIQSQKTAPGFNDRQSNDGQSAERLVQEAKRLFHEQGFGQTTMSKIATAAGMTATEAKEFYASPQEICDDVIKIYQAELESQFEKYSENSNPRQSLSLYLDSLSDNAEKLITCGCPITNLYFDVRREDKALAQHASELLRQRFNWISAQFVLITRVESNQELPERLVSAIHGICILAQATGNARLIRSQVNQLKSWIRSM